MSCGHSERERPFRVFYECATGIPQPTKWVGKDHLKPLLGFDNYFWRYMTYDPDEDYGDDKELFEQAKQEGVVLIHDRIAGDWDATDPGGTKPYKFYRNGMASGRSMIDKKDLRGRNRACGCVSCRPPNCDYDNCCFQPDDERFWVGAFETLPIQYKHIASDRNNDADDEDYAPGGQAAKRQKKKPAAKKTGLVVMKQSG